jgi:hypothetical protein
MELARDTDESAVEEAGGQSTSIIVARLSARSRVREGDPLELSVATRGLHFFDRETGVTIPMTGEAIGTPPGRRKTFTSAPTPAGRGS